MLSTVRLSALMLALSLSRTASAQTSAVVDQATFMIARKGTPVGRESFSIILAPGPGGQVFRATASGALGDDRVSTILATDSTGTPVSYDVTLSQRGEVQLRLRGNGRPDRFIVVVQSKGSEAAKEYPVRPGTVLLDEDVFYQYWFVPRAGNDTVITVISPRTLRREPTRIENMGVEALPIGGQDITARRLALVDSAGGRREVWFDQRGRLLKVSIPEKGLVALRDDPPR